MPVHSLRDHVGWAGAIRTRPPSHRVTAPQLTEDSVVSIAAINDTGVSNIA